MIATILAIVALVLVIIIIILFFTLTPRVTNNSASTSQSEVMSASATQTAITSKSVQIDDASASATTTYSSQKIEQINSSLTSTIDGKVVNEPDYSKLTPEQQTGSAWSTSVQNTKFNQLGTETAEKLWADTSIQGQIITALTTGTTGNDLATTLSGNTDFQTLVKDDVTAYLNSYFADGKVINDAVKAYFDSGATVPEMTIENLTATNATVTDLTVSNVKAPTDGDNSIITISNGIKVNGDIETDTLGVTGDTTLVNVDVSGVLKPVGETAQVIATKLAAVDNCAHWSDEVQNYIVAVKPEQLTTDDETIGYGAFTAIRSVSSANNMSTVFDIGAVPIVRTSTDSTNPTPISYISTTEINTITDTMTTNPELENNLNTMLFVKSDTVYTKDSKDYNFVGITRSVTVDGVLDSGDPAASIEYAACPTTDELEV